MNDEYINKRERIESYQIRQKKWKWFGKKNEKITKKLKYHYTKIQHKKQKMSKTNSTKNLGDYDDDDDDDGRQTTDAK